MKIVFVVSEMGPFAKTGGLADVSSSLSAAIAQLGHEVSVFLPRYKNVDIQKLGFTQVLDKLEIQVGQELETGRLFLGKLDSGVKVYFVDHPGFFERDYFYGDAHGDYPDNDRRFVFFQRAVLESLKKMKDKPDVIHGHDWQAGLMATYLKTLYANDPFFQKTKSVFTIHNFGYQGNFPPDSLTVTGLGWQEFRMERLEFYGKVSFMKASLLDADVLTTVSERYAREILTKEMGCGMEGVLAKRKNGIMGILNGIDVREWDPETDHDLAAQFSASSLDKKLVNKTVLQKEHNLEVNAKTPVFGFVSRLVDQKGVDILIPAIERILGLGVQMVCLGTGEEKYHHVLRDLAKKNKGKCSVHILFDAKMAKRIYAGSDMFLMPSQYEPCGLGQMIALRFATIPVVRRTGGLADTVADYNLKTGEGNGFSFEEYSPEALLATVRRAVEVYHQEKRWNALMHNAILCDFSWNASAKKYISVYESLVLKRAAKN